eukprot:163118-Amphidinium_carterae.1
MPVKQEDLWASKEETLSHSCVPSQPEDKTDVIQQNIKVHAPATYLQDASNAHKVHPPDGTSHINLESACKFLQDRDAVGANTDGKQLPMMSKLS